MSGAEPEQTSPAAAAMPATKSAQSRLSVASEGAIANLVYFDEHLIGLEDAVTNIRIGFYQDGLPAQDAKDGLLEVEKKARKLKEYGVEALNTGHLKSGLALAKELKGNALDKLEKLLKSIEDLSTDIEIKEIEGLNRRSSLKLDSMYHHAPELVPSSSAPPPAAPQPAAAAAASAPAETGPAGGPKKEEDPSAYKVRLCTEMVHGLAKAMEEMSGEELATGLDDQTAATAARLVSQLQKTVLTPRGLTPRG